MSFEELLSWVGYILAVWIINSFLITLLLLERVIRGWVDE